ncbi:MAG: hypothetical protein ABW276_01255, partial [Casimicrobiaceae bacterium]
KAMDDALSTFMSRWRVKGPPYATSRDLIAELRRVTPAEHQAWIDDLFENITFFDSRAVKAAARKRPDGKFDVDLVVTAKKSHADTAGNETEVPLDATIDIGVQDAKGDYLLLEKRRIKSGENRFTVTVAGEPAKAGIDPLDKLIDRDTGDNTVEVTMP